MSNSAEVDALVNKTIETFGHLDCAFNNAAIAPFSPLISMSEEDWDRVIDINLKGTWLCLKYEIGAMLKQGGGVIVNIASVGGVVGIAGYTTYSAAKGGIIALTRAAAIEYAKEGIRINVVSPGAINTELLATFPADLLAQIPTMHPVQRIGKTEEIAEAVVWLCSDAASFVIGHNMIIDGGYTAQ